MINYFNDIVRIIKNILGKEEIFSASFSAESLDYARFNHAKIRQAGTVDQQYLDLDLYQGKKRVSRTIGLANNCALDTETIKLAISVLREQLKYSEEDPFFLISEENNSTEQKTTDQLQDKEFIINQVLKEAKNLDLVGCYIGGPIFRGFANSFGQFNWFQKSSFILDTSVYYSNDKAIKQNYSDIKFDENAFAQKIKEARIGLELFKKEAITLTPGAYRVYFAPAAVHEILTMLNYGGFSQKNIEVKSSPLMPLFYQQKKLSKHFSLFENIANGVGPNFQHDGFLKPSSIPIIQNGELINGLISPKTAKEYNLQHNGADEDESLCSMDLACGDLEDKDILSTLKDGLVINNLWYLNFSDRNSGRITGMTRFFCYTVKDGQPEAPFSVVRFDDTIYRIFGDNLKHLTKKRELLISNDTYDERSTSCAILPGIIAENVRFTL